MNLILLRHAEAEEGISDFNRKLTPKGRKDCQKVAKWIGKRLKGDFVVISSPFVRAKETASYFLKDVEICQELEPTSTPNSFLKALSKIDAENIIAVGHQPLMGYIVSAILKTETPFSIKKCGFFWFKGDSIKELELYCVIHPQLL